MLFQEFCVYEKLPQEVLRVYRCIKTIADNKFVVINAYEILDPFDKDTRIVQEAYFLDFLTDDFSEKTFYNSLEEAISSFRRSFGFVENI